MQRINHLNNHNLEGQSVEQFANPVFTGITEKERCTEMHFFFHFLSQSIGYSCVYTGPITNGSAPKLGLNQPSVLYMGPFWIQSGWDLLVWNFDLFWTGVVKMLQVKSGLRLNLYFNLGNWVAITQS